MGRIIADYRERKVISVLKDALGEVEVTNLPVGDFLVVCNDTALLIERKEVSDFIASMKSNRLWEQLRRMLIAELMNLKVVRRALLLHGLMSEALKGSGVGWNNVMGAFMEIQYNYGIPLFHAENDDSLIQFFRIALKRECEGKNGAEIRELWARPIPKRGMSEDEWKVYVLSSLPLVGEKMAESLLSHFGSIERVAQANPVELRKVEGIGEKRAKLIFKIFH